MHTVWPDVRDSGLNGEERKRRARWRQEVFSAARRLGSLVVPDGRDTTGVQDLIDTARDAALAPATPRAWWNGTLIQRAWVAMHNAEARLVDLLEDDAAALYWEYATGRRRSEMEPAARLSGGPGPGRTSASASLLAYYNQSDRLYQRTRVLRNRLIGLTVVGVVISALLLSVGALGLQVARGRYHVVTGIWQFLLVALFGAIGAFISGLPALSAASPDADPYRTGPYQLALKLAVGPMFALLGVMALNQGFVDQVQVLQHFGISVVLWAAIFGGAQQVVTGVLDRKASVLAHETAALPTPGSVR